MTTETTNGYISRGNMAIILSAAALVVGGLGWIFSNQNSVIDGRLKELREDVKNIEKGYLRKDEHEEFKRGLEKDIGLIRRTQDARADAIVPRAEHNARWKASDDFVLLLSNRINEVRNNLASITTPQSQFTRMENDITELRKQQAALLEVLAKKP
jgi:hypothetical protein